MKSIVNLLGSFNVAGFPGLLTDWQLLKKDCAARRYNKF
jgi:hypothetical protein